MSWNSYIDVLLGSKLMHSAALIGLEDGTYWAFGGMEVPLPEEVQPLLDYVSTPVQALKSGILINEVKYFGLQHGYDGESRYVIFKKGSAGGCAFTTNQLLICGIYGPPCRKEGSNEEPNPGAREPVSHPSVHPADCHACVKNIASYLSKLGY